MFRRTVRGGRLVACAVHTRRSSRPKEISRSPIPATIAHIDCGAKGRSVHPHFARDTGGQGGQPHNVRLCWLFAVGDNRGTEGDKYPYWHLRQRNCPLLSRSRGQMGGRRNPHEHWLSPVSRNVPLLLSRVARAHPENRASFLPPHRRTDNVNPRCPKFRQPGLLCVAIARGDKPTNPDQRLYCSLVIETLTHFLPECFGQD